MQEKVNKLWVLDGYGHGLRTGLLEFTYRYNYGHYTDRAMDVAISTDRPLANRRDVLTDWCDLQMSLDSKHEDLRLYCDI